MRKLTLYLILAAIWSGCDVTGTADPIVISTVQAEMQLDLANPFDAPTQFAFRMSTIDEKCADAQILADGAVQGQNVHIAVSGLLVEPSCPADLAIAKKDVHMELMPGEYRLSMNIGEDLLNSGVLTFDGDMYSLEMYSTVGIRIGHSELNRIPEGVIWGSISGDQSISQLRQEFLTALSPLTSTTQLQEGYYGHFTIYHSDILNLTLTDDILYNFNHLFVYQLDGDISALQSVIDDFRAQHGDLINISCTTWKGDSL